MPTETKEHAQCVQEFREFLRIRTVSGEGVNQVPPSFASFFFFLLGATWSVYHVIVAGAVHGHKNNIYRHGHGESNITY